MLQLIEQVITDPIQRPLPVGCNRHRDGRVPDAHEWAWQGRLPKFIADRRTRA